MHPSALDFGKRFFDAYCIGSDVLTIVDVGAQNVNGSLKDVCPSNAKYIGVDFIEGSGVDVVLVDPYKLPFDDNSIDIVVCSSVFEHSQFFWLLYLEVIRILKPNGIFYLNVPSNGYFHRYPVDCWRFYPDSAAALVDWGKCHGYHSALLESFIGAKKYNTIDADAWNDFVAVFLKDSGYVKEFPTRIVHSYTGYRNGFCDDVEMNKTESQLTDDFLIIKARETELERLSTVNEESIQKIRNLENEISKNASSVLFLEQTLAEKEQQLTAIIRALNVRDEASIVLSGEISKLEQAMRALEIDATIRDERATGLSAQNANLEAMLAGILASKSWRFTASLRSIRSFFHKN